MQIDSFGGGGRFSGFGRMPKPLRVRYAPGDSIGVVSCSNCLSLAPDLVQFSFAVARATGRYGTLLLTDLLT